jgi:hypothetical protein
MYLVSRETHQVNVKNIEKKQAMAHDKYETAKAIRRILDQLRDVAKKAGEDPDEIEAEALELVSEED